MRLGAGFSAGVSPDGRWFFLAPSSGRGTRLQAVPTGPGEARTFDLGSVEALISGTRLLSLSADGRLVAFTGSSSGADLRGFVIDREAGAPARAVTPEGVDEVLLSPDLSHLLFRFRRHTSYLAIVTGVK